jgi:lipoate-protein ligase A
MKPAFLPAFLCARQPAPMAGAGREEAGDNIIGGSMTDQPLALTVEQGLHAEQELLAAVCRGERDAGVLFWRPTDHALVMPRRMSRLDNFEAACAELAIAGWPVLLRETGGEPVPQSHSTVNVALVYVAPRSEGDHGRIENAYERLCLPLCDVLREWGGVASVGKSMAPSAMAATTST